MKKRTLWKVKLKVKILEFGLNLSSICSSCSFPVLSCPVAKSGENGQGGSAGGGASTSSERLYWPAASALTARLRRLITAYQRSNRREQLRQEALNRPDGRRRRRREFLPSIAMVSETGGGATYIQDGSGVFMTEGTSYLAKGGAYFTKGGQFIPEGSPVMNTSSLIPDGAMYFKERRQRYCCSSCQVIQNITVNT